ncbi:MAG: helix-turn-helix domain-containing protein [Planctomycetaceae bacterium]|jgi:excisionase family DNA binding protein|nr:helix-turn-helix domain-containing protein [Planctomycetaceae bacterium]
MTPSETSPQRMIDVRDVATILSVSTRTVRRLTSSGVLPQPVRFGRNVRWRLADIDAWIAHRGACNQSTQEKR